MLVHHIPRRSDQGSIVTDDLSKAQLHTLPPFLGCHSLREARRLQRPVPQSILSWIARPTPDDLSWGPRVIAELQSGGIPHLPPPPTSSTNTFPPFQSMSETLDLVESSLAHALALLGSMSPTGLDSSLRREVAHELESTQAKISTIRLIGSHRPPPLEAHGLHRDNPLPTPSWGLDGSWGKPAVIIRPDPEHTSRRFPPPAPIRPICFPNSSIPVIRQYRSTEQQLAFQQRYLPGGSAGPSNAGPLPSPRFTQAAASHVWSSFLRSRDQAVRPLAARLPPHAGILPFPDSDKENKPSGPTANRVTAPGH